MAGHSGFNLNAPHNLVLTTAVLSNLINNSAAVMLLLKVITLSQPVTAYILALANSFGGSLIIIGSVSNIIVVQQAREMGINISFWDFARLGIPVTLAAPGRITCLDRFSGLDVKERRRMRNGAAPMGLARRLIPAAVNSLIFCETFSIEASSMSCIDV